ncbi:MAG: hypothetical protein AAGF12_35260 [Myxococcota bacterium]
MASFWGAVGLLVTLGCGGVPESARRAPAPPDHALTLARRLPDGASGCVVSRPPLLSAQERAIAGRFNTGAPILAFPRAPIVASVTAWQEDPVGRRSRVTLYRTSVSRAQARVFFNGRSNVRLRWGQDSPVEGATHTAEFLDDHTLVIRSGRWRSRPPGVEGECRALAATHRSAIEVASRHAAVVVLGDVDDLPRRIDAVLTRSARGLLRTRRVSFAYPDLAHEWALRDEERLELWVQQGVPLPDRSEREVEGSTVVTEQWYLWEDLEFARRDEERVARAEREEASGRQPMPIDDVDLDNLAHLRDQLRLHQDRLVGVSGAARDRVLSDLRLLLERGIRVHPLDAELHWSLGQLLVRDLRDGAAVTALADAALDAGVGDRDAWRALRRHGAALVGLRELRLSLRQVGVVPDRGAEAAATEISSVLRSGVDYEVAEGLWLAQHELGPLVSRARMSPIRPLRLSDNSVFDALSALVSAGRPTGALYAVVLGRKNPWARLPVDNLGPQVIALERGEEALLVGAMTSDPDHRASELSDAVSAFFQPGELRVGLFLVPFGADARRRSAEIVLEGELEDGHWTIRRAAGRATRVRWSRVDRYLGQPLSTIEARLFPVPELRIDANSSADLDAITEAAVESDGISCTPEGMVVRCREGDFGLASPVVPFVRALVGRLLAPDIAMLGR